MPARILIVEDNKANLQLMSYLLKAFGHTVLAAGDGEEGLTLARKETFDLIICDVQLPKVDGYEVARQLKGHPALKAIPLVAVTALAMVGDRDKVLAAGFDGYLAKPVVPRTFVPQVEAFLKPELHVSAKSAPAPASPPAPARSKATVLVVDNSPVNLNLAKKTLEPFGYAVVPANSMEEALTTARQRTPDLILSDLHMPNQDGFDLIQAVKADPQLQTIPFVFISSSHFHDRDRERGLALGAVKFLVRPMSPQTLVAEIEACLPKREGG